MKLYIIILILFTGLFCYTDYNGTMKDDIGINVHQFLWRDHYESGGRKDADYDIADIFKWVRVYYGWDWFEGHPGDGASNDNYHFNDPTWKAYDNYFTGLNNDGANILLCVQGQPTWLPGDLPYANSGLTEQDYIEKSEFMAQLAVRYGPSGTATTGEIESSDKLKGMDLIRYFEDANEPNQWWENYAWDPNKYGKWLNAAHDGLNMTKDASHPLLGVKDGDSAAYHVMAGMANNGLEPTTSYNGNYIEGANSAAGRQPYDVINMHIYFSDSEDFAWTGPAGRHAGARGISPENGMYERNLNEILNLINWRNVNSPGTPVWITEFGWDTYTTDTSGASGQLANSDNWASENDSADYLLRGFALFKEVGVDKIFMYWDRDGSATNTGKFGSCGITIDKSSYYDRKISYYYLKTMMHTIGDYSYDSVFQKDNSGTIRKYIYKFTKSTDDIVLMAWCREYGSKFNNGSTINNVSINIPNMSDCIKITPTDNSLLGVSNSIAISGSGNTTSFVIPQLSETPIFLHIKGTNVGSSSSTDSSSAVSNTDNFTENIFAAPNPA